MERTKAHKRFSTAVIAALLATMAAGLLAGCGGTSGAGLFGSTGKGSVSVEGNSAVRAKIDADGTAYIPLYNGKTIVIDGGVAEAWLTKDRKTVVVLQEDGILYVTDPKLSKKQLVAERAETIKSLRESGIIYADRDGVFYRYLFADASTVELGEVGSWTAARKALSVAYVTADKDLFVLRETATEPEKIKKLIGDAKARFVSDDGQIYAWEIRSNGYRTMYFCENGETEQYRSTAVETNKGYSTGEYVNVTTDGKLIVFVNDERKQIYIKQPGEKVRVVQLNNAPLYGVVYTSAGSLSSGDSNQPCFYVQLNTDKDYEYSVYAVTLDGDEECLLSRVRSFWTQNGSCVYLDSDNVLYTAKIDGTRFSGVHRVDRDVDFCIQAFSGEYAYYYTDTVFLNSDLYAYKLGDEAPKKVASNVGEYTAEDSIDGATVFFLKDTDYIREAYVHYGTLMAWNYETGKQVYIDTDVIEDTLSCGIRYGAVDPKSFTYERLSYVSPDGEVYTDWMYYNGKESTIIASNIKLS